MRNASFVRFSSRYPNDFALRRWARFLRGEDMMQELAADACDAQAHSFRGTKWARIDHLEIYFVLFQFRIIMQIN